MKQETEFQFLVGTVILGFLSIFKKGQASSHFAALNSVCLSRCQRDVIPLSRWGRDFRLSLGSPQGIQTTLPLVRWKTSLNLSHCREIGLNLKFIWATPSYFTFLRWHQSSSRLVRDFWGTLSSSVKQIKAPYLFDWEKGIALHAIRGIGPHLSVMGKSHDFSWVVVGT